MCRETIPLEGRLRPGKVINLQFLKKRFQGGRGSIEETDRNAGRKNSILRDADRIGDDIQLCGIPDPD